MSFLRSFIYPTIALLVLVRPARFIRTFWLGAVVSALYWLVEAAKERQSIGTLKPAHQTARRQRCGLWSLPDELIERIFYEVGRSSTPAMASALTLVSRRWQGIGREAMFFGRTKLRVSTTAQLYLLKNIDARLLQHVGSAIYPIRFRYGHSERFLAWVEEPVQTALRRTRDEYSDPTFACIPNAQAYWPRVLSLTDFVEIDGTRPSAVHTQPIGHWMLALQAVNLLRFQSRVITLDVRFGEHSEFVRSALIIDGMHRELLSRQVISRAVIAEAVRTGGLVTCAVIEGKECWPMTGVDNVNAVYFKREPIASLIHSSALLAKCVRIPIDRGLALLSVCRPALLQLTPKSVAYTPQSDAYSEDEPLPVELLHMLRSFLTAHGSTTRAEMCVRC